MTGSYLNCSFTDFDELAVAVQAWDLDLRQLERGPFTGSISQFVGGRVQFGRARFGRSLEQFGSSPRGLVTFGIPADHSLRLFWRGQPVTGSQIMALPQNRELNAVSNPDFDIYTFSVSDELLMRTCAESGFPDFPDLLGERELFHGTPEAMRSLRQLCARIHRRIEKGLSVPEISALQRELEGDFTGALLTALTSSIPIDCTPPSPRLRHIALRKSLEYIGDHRTDPVTVRDLLGISGASWRTLDYAFRERFDITPKEYLKTVRLNGVHKELRKVDPSSARICDIANGWGFWHMGQFAADYRRLFGKLPSATLKRNGRGA